MFTGIAREMGKIVAVERIPGGVRLKLRARKSLEGLKLGDSIAINGACQTVMAMEQDSFSVEALHETLRRTTMNGWKPGDLVNLENPLSLHDPMGGHLVTGHVDGVGVIRAKVRRAGDMVLRIQAPQELMEQVFERGSVALDGVSLTVVAVQGNQFSVTLIPYTQRQTTLGSKEVGDGMNLETDMIVKAVQRLLGSKGKNRGLTRERLEELEF
jgi:riboflavin synthase